MLPPSVRIEVLLQLFSLMFLSLSVQIKLPSNRQTDHFTPLSCFIIDEANSDVKHYIYSDIRILRLLFNLLPKYH